ncbi:CYTH domain-containing protein [Undibacterium sp. RTI2.1]|uniref:CYTH domain-containing protein n=1 Tax=unclassified Undibacterium TaxID=2630295 RepID=UPI002AB5034C|nr:MULTISPECIES: CYTH domain-containing protein [unclassified Undibacterium]MDY7537799.1 CYTH domain-containing protein [Undibacterium sp. 5I1]MEB0030514.1 CYTH domain-containing protein [Undibacterium sp. RTI2.1]MEB0116986.1 CYTH domain-containing protein [Undibacterium sp. RTI2.2]MEB0229916.1 CYTH domain-containing protein [Undibacterium sp. 10I3]MEB0257619.1 CYTH domain-containing protein [Undibacterium sp. 5I1]
MGIEIERKFLVTNTDWKQQGQGVHLCQGYICSDPGRIVRVRIEGEQAMLTIKGKTEGISRGEWEYPIPVQDARELLSGLCAQPLIEKYRYRILYQGLMWEVDEFLGDNAGLIVAEVELESESQAFSRPAWLGEEVSHDHRYANANLLKHPFCQW